MNSLEVTSVLKDSQHNFFLRIKHMVSAFIVMCRSAVVCVVAGVPDVGKLSHGRRLSLVQLVKEAGVDHSAILSGSACIDANRSADLFFVGSHDVDQIPQGLGGVVALADVDVNAASPTGAGLCASLAEQSDDRLQGLDVLVGKDGGHHLALFSFRSVDADVSLEFPNPALLVLASPAHVPVLAGCVPCGRPEELGNLSGGFFAGDVVHLNLDPDGLHLHGFDLLSGLIVHGVYLLLSCSVPLAVCAYYRHVGRIARP